MTSNAPLGSCSCGTTGMVHCPVHNSGTLGTGSTPPEPYSLTGEVRPPDDTESATP